MERQTKITTTKYVPISNVRNTIVQRSTMSRPSLGGRKSFYSGSGYGMTSSAPIIPQFSSGVYQSLSSSGVTSIRENRSKEKKEMQGLNERLAGYIEQVRFLEARIKMLEDQLAQCMGKEKLDLQPIREMYEGELEQARKVIDELAKDKGVVDAKVAGLQDEVDRLQGIIDIHEKNKADYIQKLNTLTVQIGDYEGELGTLRLRIKHAEDENDKLRELLNKANDDLRRMRCDLDNETAAHIDAENRAQTAEEAAEFFKSVLDKIPDTTPGPTLIQGMDTRAWWSKELSQAIKDLRMEYDNVVEHMRADMEQRMNSQLQQLQSGAVKDNMESAYLKEEVKKLKGQLSDKTALANDAEARLRTMDAELSELSRQYADLKREYDEECIKHKGDVDRLQSEMETCLRELQAIMDAKLSLELEICCYRQLLEGEENRAGLKQIVEQAVGVQSAGAQKLSEFVQQSSSGMSSESTGRMVQSRSSKGPVAFAEAALDGSFVTIENTKKGSPVNLDGWVIKRTFPGKPSSSDKVFKFPNVTLDDKRKIRLISQGYEPTTEEERKFHCIPTDHLTWGMGNCETVLLDNRGDNKASLKCSMSMR